STAASRRSSTPEQTTAVIAGAPHLRCHSEARARRFAAPRNDGGGVDSKRTSATILRSCMDRFAFVQTRSGTWRNPHRFPIAYPCIGTGRPHVGTKGPAHPRPKSKLH